MNIHICHEKIMATIISRGEMMIAIWRDQQKVKVTSRPLDDDCHLAVSAEVKGNFLTFCLIPTLR